MNITESRLSFSTYQKRKDSLSEKESDFFFYEKESEWVKYSMRSSFTSNSHTCFVLVLQAILKSVYDFESFKYLNRYKFYFCVLDIFKFVKYYMKKNILNMWTFFIKFFNRRFLD